MYMSYTTELNGRLCNQFIRNLATSVIAERHDLKVTYSNPVFFENIGLNLYSGNQSYDTHLELTDSNYFETLNMPVLRENVNTHHSFFQTREITNMLYERIRSDPLKTSIIAKNNYKERYNRNNDCFVHVRLSDVTHFNPGLAYYLTALSRITFDNLYIGTDSSNHKIIHRIVEAFPGSIVLDYNELDTIQFGSTCKHVILSHGSFSAVIGYLAYDSIIYYPEYRNMWHGDMFSIPGWICIPAI